MSPSAPVTPVFIQYLLPDPLVLTGQPSPVTCADLPNSPDHGGLTAPLTTISIEDLFNWSDVPDVQDAQLDYIAQLSTATLESLKTCDIAAFQDLSKLNYTQSVWARDGIHALQASLDAQATAAALNLLDCWWENTEQTVSCAEGMKGNVLTVTVASGAIRSDTSQEDADAQALLSAVSQTDCWWESTVTVNCPADSYGPDGTATAVSTLSQEDADAQALAQAQANLGPCVFHNKLLILDCATAYPGQFPRLVSNIPVAGLEKGQSITVAEGLFEGDTQEIADTLAMDYALSMLDCQCGNEALVYVCPAVTYKDRVTGLDVSKAASSANTLFRGISGADVSPSYTYEPPTVHIPANAFLSTVSCADAQQQAVDALEVLKAAMDCIYCNDAILPECDTSADVQSQNYKSSNRTLGLAANKVCGSDIEQVMTISYQLAGVPAAKVDDTQDNCVECAYDIPGCCGICVETEGSDCKAKWPAKYKVQLIKETVCNVAVSQVWLCSNISQANLQEAIRQELDKVLSDCGSCAQCEFGNRPIRLYCGALGTNSMDDTALRAYLTDTGPWPEPGSSDYLVLGKDEISGDAQLKDVSILVPANRFRSDDPVQADMDAIRFAQSTLQCLYANPELRIFCGAKDVPMSVLLQAAKNGGNIHPNYAAPDFGNPGAVGTWGNLVTLPDGSTQVSDESTGSPVHPVIVSAGLYTADYTAGETYDTALALAINDGLSRLECFKLNPLMDLICENFKDANGNALLSPESAAVKHDLGSNNYKNPAKLAKGLFRTYESQVDLDEQIRVYANAMLNCTYTNADTPAPPCADNETALNNPTIRQGTVRHAATPQDAAQQAGALAVAMHICAPNSALGGGDGAPGGDGKQTNCQGQCFGYYS